MLKEEKLIMSVHRVLSSSEPQDTAANRNLAKQYCDMCSELNQRLERCADYLHKNRTVEAVSFAEMPPPVLEVAAKLKFPGLDEWRELCSKNDWPLPVAIHDEIIELLNDAYLDNLNLKPLVDLYRKKNRKGSLEEKIHLLRKIRALDQANPSWADNLEKLERSYINSLTESASKALEGNDESAIQNAYTLLCDPEFINPPPKAIMGKLVSALGNFRGERLRMQARAVLSDAADAYSMMDMGVLGKALRKWDELNQNPGFTAEQSDLVQIEEAKEWYGIQAAERRKKKEFEDSVELFEKELQTSENEMILDNLFLKLNNYEAPIPKHLLTRYHESKGNFRIVRKRNFVFKFCIVIIFILATVGAVAFLVHRQSQANICLNALRSINEAVKKGNLNAAVKLMESFKDSHPTLYSSRIEFKDKEIELRRLVDADSLRASRVKEIVERCDGIIESGIDNDAETFETLAAELSTIVKDDQEKLQLSRIVSEKNAYRSRTSNQLSELYREQSRHLVELSKPLNTMKPDINPESYLRLVEDFAANIQKLKSLDIADKDFKLQTEKDFGAWLKVYENRYEKGKLANDKWKRATGMLYDNIYDLKKYNLDLENFKRLYSDFPNCAEVEKSLAMIPAYEAVLDLKEYNPGTETRDQLNLLLNATSLQSENCIWNPGISDFLNWRSRILEYEPGGRRRISDYTNRPVMDYKAWTFTANDGLVIEFFHYDQFPVKRLKGSSTETIEICSTIGHNRGTAFLMFQSKDAGKTWSVYQGEQRSQDKKIIYNKLVYANLNLIRRNETTFYADFFKTFANELAEVSDDNLEIFLTEYIGKIKTSTEVNKYMKLMFLSNILDFLGKISYKRTEDFTQELEKVRDLTQSNQNLSVDSLNKCNPDGEELIRKVDDLLANIPEFDSRAKVDRVESKIQLYGFGRRINLAGYVERDSEGTFLAKTRTFLDIKELWILTQSEEEGLKFVKVGKVHANKGILFPACNHLLFDGQLLFSPFDNRNTNELINEIKSDFKSLEIEWTSDALPKYWPVLTDEE